MIYLDTLFVTVLTLVLCENPAIGEQLGAEPVSVLMRY
jgi:hypothetical protein